MTGDSNVGTCACTWCYSNSTSTTGSSIEQYQPLSWEAIESSLFSRRLYVGNFSAVSSVDIRPPDLRMGPPTV